MFIWSTPTPDLRCTARGGWLTISPKRSTYKNDSHRISVELYEILGLDEGAMEVRVEPGVSMGQLSHYRTSLPSIVNSSLSLPLPPS